jgi:hypothetical protein
MLSKRLIWLVLGLPIVAACSKGPPLERVTGQVTLDGKPVPLATVEFIPENGRPSQAVTDAEGRYELLYTLDRAGSLVGKHKVRISTWRQPEIDEQERVTLHPETLPARYNYESELTYEVQPDQENIADFALKSGGRVVQPPK